MQGKRHKSSRFLEAICFAVGQDISSVEKFKQYPKKVHDRIGNKALGKKKAQEKMSEKKMAQENQYQKNIAQAKM